jgi:hypothetical protein
MDLDYQDNFTVFVRTDSSHVDSSDEVEQPLASFSSFTEARRFLRLWRRPAHECVIRFQGDTGGGD